MSGVKTQIDRKKKKKDISICINRRNHTMDTNDGETLSKTTTNSGNKGEIREKKKKESYRYQFSVSAHIQLRLNDDYGKLRICTRNKKESSSQKKHIYSMLGISKTLINNKMKRETRNEKWQWKAIFLTFEMLSKFHIRPHRRIFFLF